MRVLASNSSRPNRVRSVAAVRITMQHVSWSRAAAELALWRVGFFFVFFGQMAFSRDMLLRRGSQIMSICFDTAWRYSAAPDPCRCARAGGCEGAGEGGGTRWQRTLWLKMKIAACRRLEVKLAVAAVNLKMTFYSRLSNSNETAQSVDRQELRNAAGWASYWRLEFKPQGIIPPYVISRCLYSPAHHYWHSFFFLV